MCAAPSHKSSHLPNTLLYILFVFLATWLAVLSYANINSYRLKQFCTWFMAIFLWSRIWEFSTSWNALLTTNHIDLVSFEYFHFSTPMLLQFNTPHNAFICEFISPVINLVYVFSLFSPPKSLNHLTSFMFSLRKPNKNKTIKETAI